MSRNGTELIVGGAPWKFAGYNLPCANPFLLTSAQIGTYLDHIKNDSGANVVRMWFFQSQGGPGNWTAFDRVLAAVKARGMRTILTLTNEESTCDEPKATTPEKPLSWYQSGYESPEGGYALSFRDYAKQVAAHYADEPAVAFWQLVNEAAAPTVGASGQLTCDDAAAMAALRSFSDSMVGDIRAVDPHHLVDLGTLTPGSCGIGDQASYQYVHAGALDLCEYHDYGAPAIAMPNGLQKVINACHALGKPVFVGEAGIPGDVQPDGTPATPCTPWPSCPPALTITTLGQRALFFQAKISAAAKAGVAGYVIWVKSPYYTDTSDAYAIADSDPVEGVLAAALAPYPATSATPPANSTAPAAASALHERTHGEAWWNTDQLPAGPRPADRAFGLE